MTVSRTIIIRLATEASTEARLDALEEAIDGALDNGSVQETITDLATQVELASKENPYDRVFALRHEGNDEEANRLQAELDAADDEEGEEHEDDPRIVDASARREREGPDEKTLGVIMSQNYWTTDELLRALGVE